MAIRVPPAREQLAVVALLVRFSKAFSLTGLPQEPGRTTQNRNLLGLTTWSIRRPARGRQFLRQQVIRQVGLGLGQGLGRPERGRLLA